MRDIFPFSIQNTAKLLEDLLLPGQSVPSGEIREFCTDSRKVRKDSLFCALAGAGADGHDFIVEVLAKGASLVIAEKMPPGVFPGKEKVLLVRDSRMAWGLLASFLSGDPGRKFPLFAVTGTNGKTSIVFFLKKIRERCFQAPCGLISTVAYKTGNDAGEEEGVRTTPSPEKIFSLLAEMEKNNCCACMMEASSHGLVQSRLYPLSFAGCIFTNLTGDHLDYHKDMEHYFQAKKLLFTRYCTSGKSISLINIDDPWGKRLYQELKEELAGNVISFSFREEADARGKILSMSSSGGRFSLSFQGKEYFCRLPLIGEHNLYNGAQALVMALAEGLPEDKVLEALESPDLAPPGRLEPFLLPSGGRVFVDYAHTHDALENVLKALVPLKEKRLLVLFGCGGNRDRTKRPKMGRIGIKYADKLFLTSDNPRWEDPEAILDEILSGIPEEKLFKVFRESDRRKAVASALKELQEGDLLLIAGKGHENTQEIKGEYFHFDDREEVEIFIRGKNL